VNDDRAAPGLIAQRFGRRLDRQRHAIQTLFGDQLIAALAHQNMAARLRTEHAVGQHSGCVSVDVAHLQLQTPAFAAIADEPGRVAHRNLLDRLFVEKGFDLITLIADQKRNALAGCNPLSGLQIGVDVMQPPGEGCARLIAGQGLIQPGQLDLSRGQLFLNRLQARP